VGSEPFDGSNRAAVVGREGGEEDVDAGKDVGFLLRFTFLRDKCVTVIDESLQERQEHLGVELCI